MATNKNPEDSKPKTFEELNALADKGELTETELKLNVAAYAKALQEEFEATSEAKANEDKRVTDVRELFKNNAAAAAAQIVHLSMFAEKESTQLAASKYIVDKSFDDAEIKDSELDKLFAQLGVGN